MVVMNQVFAEMQRAYINVFRWMYPSKNSTGFTERNLSVNFAEAYKKVHPDSHAWYEFQFGEKNNLHYDAVIVNPADKEILLVESKRIKAKGKIEEIHNDILRIQGAKDLYAGEFKDRIREFQTYQIVGVILADVWTEGNMKSRVRDSFAQKTFVEDHFPELGFMLDGLQYDIRSFDGQLTDNWMTGEFAEKLPFLERNYYLLSLIWNVTSASARQI